MRKRGSGAVAVEFTYPYEDSLPLEVDVGDSELVGKRHGVQWLN